MEGIFIVAIVFIIFAAIFGSIASIFVLPSYFKSRERLRMQETVQAAIERGQELPMETIEALTKGLKPIASPVRDLRVGIVWLSVAFGISFMGYLMDPDGWEAFYPALGFATVPGIVGVVYLLFAATKLGAPKK